MVAQEDTFDLGLDAIDNDNDKVAEKKKQIIWTWEDLEDTDEELRELEREQLLDSPLEVTSSVKPSPQIPAEEEKEMQLL